MFMLAQVMPARGFGVPESQWELVDWQRKPDPDRPSDTDWTVPDVRRHYVQPRTAYAETTFRRLQRLLHVLPDSVIGYETGQAISRVGFPDFSHPVMAALSAEWLIYLIEFSPYFRARAAGLGDDIVPDPRLPGWVAPVAVGGLILAVATTFVMLNQPVKRRR